MLRAEKTKLVYHYDAEELWIEGWGKNGLRIRATKNAQMPAEDWALNPEAKTSGEIEFTEAGAGMRNGKINQFITNSGKITVYDQSGKILLEEY